MNEFQEQILEHYHNPRNFGKPTWIPTHKAELVNLSCGDEIKVYLQVDKDIVRKIAFSGEGCSISLASASLLTLKLINKSYKQIINMTYNDIQSILKVDLTISRIKCALLPLEAFKKACLI